MTPHIIEREGRAAFEARVPATDCPYTFDKSKFWASKSYEGFNTVRWKLDAWMKGWLDAQKESAPPKPDDVLRRMLNTPPKPRR